MTTETAVHRDRYEKTAALGKAGVYQTSLDHKGGQMEFWQNKCSTLETKKVEQVRQHKVALAKKMVDTHKQQDVSQICFCFLHCCGDIFISFLLCRWGQTRGTK
jgi:hypothetical protein